ncbi:putative cytochrome c oxidase assembly factor [Trypanosoma vivax]|nr:putative cytochrome c oxidase assembly factor [Trypanosoma vivax]
MGLKELLFITRHGPRSRAEFWGICLGIAVAPLMVYTVKSFDKIHETPPQLLNEEDFVEKRHARSGVSARYQLGGPFRLRESSTGEYITDQELFDNHWTLLYFGFSKCAEVCPSTMRFITDVMEALKERMESAQSMELNKVQAAFISVDSRRDSPEQLQAFLSKYGSRVRGLTGSADEVAQACQAWRVFYSSPEETDEEKALLHVAGAAQTTPEDDAYQLDHSSAIYLVGVDGKLKDFFFREMGIEDVVGRIEVHMHDVYGFKDTRKQ